MDNTSVLRALSPGRASEHGTNRLPSTFRNTSCSIHLYIHFVITLREHRGRPSESESKNHQTPQSPTSKTEPRRRLANIDHSTNDPSKWRLTINNPRERGIAIRYLPDETKRVISQQIRPQPHLGAVILQSFFKLPSRTDHAPEKQPHTTACSGPMW